ncbi:MAG TPA: MFS transporter [Stellaceae bacterium]|nr:MFS transporter [Stellaceae bacterium]
MHAYDQPRSKACDSTILTFAASRRSLRGLDGFNFFIANIQTGFGPFIAVYLTAQAWTQVDIGFVLTISGMVALAAQVPGGILVDTARQKRTLAAISATAIALSALMLAAWPILPFVLGAEVLHGLASCLMGPAIAAISLGLVAPHRIGERLGRNARYASAGNGIAAVLMGACGRLVSDRSVFVLTAILAVPALVALSRIRSREIDPVRARGGDPRQNEGRSRLHGITDNRPLLVFGASLILFSLANTPMLPLVGGIVTMRSSQWATVLIAACIVVPQILVAILSPWVGRRSETWGRRPLLLLGFAALPIRGILFAVLASPYLLVAVQILDGISAAVLGVMLPLVVADVTRGTGRYNAALGTVGTAAALGAALSTTFAGYVNDRMGSMVAFLSLAGVAVLGVGLLLLFMPETRPGGKLMTNDRH